MNEALEKVKKTLEIAKRFVYDHASDIKLAEIIGCIEAGEEALSNLISQEPFAWFCVNNVTGKMLYTDSESEAANMRDQKDKHWTVTPLVALNVVRTLDEQS